MLLSLPAFSGAAKPDVQPAKPELTDADRASLDALCERIEAAFNTNSAEAIGVIVAGGAEKTRILESLKREFLEVEYSAFQIDKADPEYRISKNRISVDVTLRYKLTYRDGSHPTVENSTIQTFVVHRKVNGEYMLITSSFFDNMGRRNSGTRLFLDGFGAIMVLFVLLAFWVWTGMAAWMMRPRSVFWRWAVFVPLAGPLLFFLIKILPGWFKRKPPG